MLGNAAVQLGEWTLSTALAQSALSRAMFGESPGTTAAAKTDWLFLFIFWISTVAFVIMMVTMVYFVIKYRRRPGVPPQRSASHNTPLELAWSIIPLVTMVPMFFLGMWGYIEKLTPASNAEEISVLGRTWQWDITYANGAEPMWGDNDHRPTRVTRIEDAVALAVFVVPAGRPISLRMTSSDVIHSFYVPAFRKKIDVFPNRVTTMSFTALEAGNDYVVYCAEYCGDFHSEMAGVIRVVPEEEYQETIQRWALGYPEEWTLLRVGEVAFQRRGCITCHSLDGTNKGGPTWKNLYGEQVEVTEGGVRKTVTIDDNYLRESILYAQAKLRVGYPNNMPNYAGVLSEREVLGLIRFYKEQSDSWREANRLRGPENGEQNGAEGEAEGGS